MFGVTLHCILRKKQEETEKKEATLKKKQEQKEKKDSIITVFFQIKNKNMHLVIKCCNLNF